MMSNIKMTIRVFKPKVTSALILLFSVFIISCHHDDPSSTKPSAAAEVAVAAPSDLLLSGIAYTIISDKDGKTLAYSKLESGKTITLRVEQPYSDATFSITDIYIFDTPVKQAVISTRTELPITTTTWIPSLVRDPTVENNANFNATGSSNTCEFVTNLTKGYALGGQLTMAVSNPSKFLVLMPTSGGTKSHIFDNSGNGYTSKNTQAYPIDLSQVTTDVSTEQITISSTSIQKYSVVVNMSGIISSDSKDDSYSYGPAQISSDFKIQLLKPSGFNSYVFSTRFVGLNGLTYINSSPSGVDFSMLDATVEIKGKAKNSVDFTTTGNIDIATPNFVQGNSVWGVCVPPISGVRSVKLPEIPAEIKSLLSNVDFSNFDYQATALQDCKNLASYLEVINATQNRRVTSSSNSVFIY